MSETSPPPWTWVETPGNESARSTIRLVDAKGEDVVWGYQVGRYDDDLPAAINAYPEERALIASAPTLRDDLGRAVDALRILARSHPTGCVCLGCETTRSLLAKLEGGR